jgi:PKD repeat protein
MKPLHVLPILGCLSIAQMQAQLSVPADLSLNFTAAASCRIVDFNQDGLNDIIADNGEYTYTYEQAATEFILYQNDGDGSFTEQELISFPEGVLESWGDLNGDGHMDLIYFEPASFDPIQYVYVMWGQSGNSFSDPVLIFQTALADDNSAFFPLLQGVCVGNLDGDSDDEVIISCNYELMNPELSYDHVGFFYSIAWDGSEFSAPVYLDNNEVTHGGFFSLSRFFCEDLSGDGLVDLVAFVLSDFGSDLTIYPGNGMGGVTPNEQFYPGGWDSFGIANLDEDIALELIFSYSDYMLRLGVDGIDSYEQWVGDAPSPELRLIDTDHDGKKDVVYGIGSGAISGTPGNIHIFKNGIPDSDWDLAVYDQLGDENILQLVVSDLDQNGEDKIIVIQGGHVYIIRIENVGPELSANFSAENTLDCAGQSIQFNDLSIGNATSWSWSFPGGTPSTSSEQNPLISYSTAGIFDVTLTITNGVEESTLTLNDYIEILPLQTYYPDLDGDGFGDIENSVQACVQPNGYILFGGDCDDSNNLIKPTSFEICNNLDDDCDQLIDEGIGTLFFADSDGDGFGNPSSSVLSCIAPIGYVAVSGDCNDNNSSVKPGAIEICNGINDDCDAFTDEGCGQLIVNDNPSGAINLPVNPITVTSITTGNLTNATVSSEATSSVITGQDLWYKFIAPAPGIRIRVQSSSTNLVVELQTMSGVVVDVENINNAPGNEYLNFGSLTEGQQYRIAVRNYNSAQGTGSFTISLSYLNDSFVNVGNPSMQYCQPIIAIPVSAFAYRFTLTSTTTGVIYQYTQNLTTSLRLSKIPGLIAGDSYTVKVNPIFNLTNGLGVTEQLIVSEVILGHINIQPWSQVFLSVGNTCPNVMTQQSFVFLNAGVCRATDYQWQFISQNGDNAVITMMRGNSLTSFNLATAGLMNGGTYNVRIRPKFENGMFGDWGPERCLQIGSSALMQEFEMEEKDESSEFITAHIVESSDHPLFVLYPNPLSGEVAFIRLANSMRGNISYMILDATGRKMVDRVVCLEGSTDLTLEETQGMSSGIYYIRISCDDWEQTQRLIIQ